MDELTFLLILAGVGVVLLVAMFTYYKHHKKINDEINDFNHQVNTIEDVLLDDKTTDDDLNHDLPNSFSASRNDHFDIDDVNFGNESFTEKQSPSQAKAPLDERELVDGVYINSKRVLNNDTEYSEPAQTSIQDSKPVNSFAPLENSNDPMSDSFLDSDEQFTESPPSVNQANRPTNSQNTSQNSENSNLNVNFRSSLKSKNIAQDSAQESIQQRQVPQARNVTAPDVSKEKQKINIVYDPVPEGVEELIISHTILTKGEFFSGRELFHALDSAGLSYGEMNIYHYPGDEKAETFALFSVANVVEPGTFNPQDPEELKTPGISMFMRLPTRMGSYEAYEEFIHVAQMIAVELDGELCDETRSQLTQQAISYKKEQIRKLNFEMAKAEKISGIKH